MHFKSLKDIRILTEELYSHIGRLEAVKPELKGKDLERCDKTILNLQEHIIDLEKMG